MNNAVATGIAVALLLLCALHWRLAGMPSRLWGIARREVSAARATDDAAVQKALQEAANAKVGTLVAGLRQYQEQIAADFRKQIADAELRTRVADRNAADTGTALETATALVRELRATINGLGELPALVSELRARLGAAPLPEEAPASAEPDDRRKTIEMRPPVTGEPPTSTTTSASDQDPGWDDPDERTKVFGADKPAPRVALRRSPMKARTE